MTDPKKAEAPLQEFLDWHANQRAQGFTTANVLASMHELQRSMRHLGGRVAQLEEREDAQDERLDSHGAAIVIIKRRLRQDANDDEMDTGQFDVAAVKRELEEAKQRRLDSERVKAEDQTWWKRSVIMWVVGAFAFVATTTVSILITLAIVGASAPKPAAPISVGK